MAWCCEDEITPGSEELLEWATHGEIVNVVGVTVRRKRMTADRARDFLAQLVTLNFQIESQPSVAELPRLQAFADRLGLTAYDAAESRDFRGR